MIANGISLSTILTIALIFLTSILIVLASFLIYYSSKALKVISHTDGLIAHADNVLKVAIGVRFSEVAELDSICFNDFEILSSKIREKEEIWSLITNNDKTFRISYAMHSEEDLEKLLLEYAKPECIEKIKESVSFYRKL